MVVVTIETPLQDAVRDLIAKSDAYSAARYPADARFGSSLEALAGPQVRLHVARIDGRVVGCAALVPGEPGTAELKRMFVDDAARGRGVGRALMQALEATAREDGVALIRLETGPLNTEALALYRRLGFTERGPFGAYQPHPMSIFMEKPLLQPAMAGDA